jgi:hypothetical protein
MFVDRTKMGARWGMGESSMDKIQDLPSENGGCTVFTEDMILSMLKSGILKKCGRSLFCFLPFEKIADHRVMGRVIVLEEN